ncbi:MAG: hypothetical protein KatS3mg005_1268 [Bryobacteraceae bacterium]|nr:MAG: hypothetical protein KatS3mg005_1268 [Bryobacteraceae bacterium]
MRAWVEFALTLPGERLSGDGKRAGTGPAAALQCLLTRSDERCIVLGDTYGCGGASGGESVLRFFREPEQSGGLKPSTLCGHCAAVYRDDETGKVQIWTNLAGSLHIYRQNGAGRGAVGTRFRDLARRSEKKLDWEGLAGFFGLGFFPGDRTFYQDIRILRPASVYEFDGQGRKVREERYWQWFHKPDERRSEAETIEQFGEVLREVLADQTREGRVALPLSGGLDSRTVAACLPDGAKPFSYGYGYTPDSIEIRIARQVAEAAGLRFRPHVIRPYLFDKLDLVAEATECFQDITQARQADVTDWLGDEADYVLAAHWGDVFCDDMGFPELEGTEEKVLQHSLKKMRKKGRGWLLEEIVRPHLKGDPEEAIREMMRAELRRLPEIEDPDFRVKVLKTEQWAFRWTLASLRMYQAAAFPRIPFLDPRVMEFFCTVPTRMVRGRRLQIEYLKRHAPRFARIPWQPYEANLFVYDWSPLWMKPVRAVRKLKRMVTGERPIQRNWEVQFFAPGQWERLEGVLLRKGAPLHEFVAPGKVRALLDLFRAQPDGANGYAVSMLLTFAVWLERVHG